MYAQTKNHQTVATVTCQTQDFIVVGVQRARAVDSTQVTTADRGLRLQSFVIRLCFPRQSP